MPLWWAEQSLGATRLPPRLRRRGPHSQRPALRMIPSAHSNFLPRFLAQAGAGVGGSRRNPVPRKTCLRDAQATRWGAEKEDRDSQLFWCGNTECSQGASDSGRCRPEAPGRWSHQRAGRVRRGRAHGANPAVRMLSPPLLYISSGSEHEVKQGGMAESGVASGHPVMPGPSRLALLPPPPPQRQGFTLPSISSTQHYFSCMMEVGGDRTSALRTQASWCGQRALASGRT